MIRLNICKFFKHFISRCYVRTLIKRNRIEAYFYGLKLVWLLA